MKEIYLLVRVLLFIVCAAAFMPFMILFYSGYKDGIKNASMNFIDEAEEIGVANKESADEVRGWFN